MVYYLFGAITSALTAFAAIRLYWTKGEDSARHKTTIFGKAMLVVFAASFLAFILLLAFYMESAT